MKAAEYFHKAEKLCATCSLTSQLKTRASDIGDPFPFNQKCPQFPCLNFGVHSNLSHDSRGFLSPVSPTIPSEFRTVTEKTFCGTFGCLDLLKTFIGHAMFHLLGRHFAWRLRLRLKSLRLEMH